MVELSSEIGEMKIDWRQQSRMFATYLNRDSFGFASTALSEPNYLLAFSGFYSIKAA